ncbi:RNA polymerase sigma factor, partial [Gammaproteobacteria bacterium]|nr:RNA polymerase sigma factor [Gammaproteobacteria bacterium]
MRHKEKNQSPVMRAFRSNESALRAFVSQLVATPSDIDDVTQETFLRAFNAEKSQEIQQPKSFLFKIARNVVLSNFARKSNRLTDCIADFDALGVIEERDVSDEVEAEETFAQYSGAIAALPQQCRRVFL